MTSPQVLVGLDLSKAQVDLALRPEGPCSAPTNAAGCALGLERLHAVPPTRVVWDATGGMEIPLTRGLAAAGVPVVVLNPRPVRDFANATGRLAKTPYGEALPPSGALRSRGPSRQALTS